MADNALSRMSLGGQLGLSVVLAGLIIGLFWWRYWSPAVEEEQRKTAQLEALRKEIRALEITANKLQEFQREVAVLEARLEVLKRILPPEKETPDLMRKVQALAAQSNLIVRKFNPAATVQKEFYQEWPISVDLDGSYHNLATFFDRVSRLSRLVNIGNLKIKSTKDQTISNTIGVSCVATTFVYVEAPVPPPGAKPGTPGARPAARAPRPAGGAR